MALAADFATGGDDRNGVGRLLAPVIAVAVLAVLGWFIYLQFADVGSVGRKIAPETTINLLPPPPPPPPPPKETPPEPPEAAKPVDVPSPAPPSPAPKAEAPAAVSISGPAQAGSDAFGVQAGSGGGMGAPGSLGTGNGPAGGGIGDDFYRRYLGQALEQAIRDDGRINRLSFVTEVSIWIESGKVTRAEILKGSGNAKTDASLVAALLKVGEIDAPPTTVKFPQRVTIRGKRNI